MRFLICLLCTVVFSQERMEEAFTDISKSIVKRLREKNRSEESSVRIGVFNFERRKTEKEMELNYSAFENYLNDQIILGLMANRGKIQFEVVERNSLEKVIREQEFAVSDYVDQNQSVKIGQLLDANVILIGTYQLLKENIQVSVKLIDVETGTLLLLESKDIELDDRLKILLGYDDFIERQEEAKRKQYEEERKRQKADNEYRKNLARRGEKFFSGGISGYYLWSSGEQKFKNWMATADFGVFYRYVVAKVGYGKYTNTIEGNYIMLGGELKMWFLRGGYLRGISLKKDETIQSNITTDNSANHFYLTVIDGDSFGLTVNYSRVIDYNLWGLGLSFH